MTKNGMVAIATSGLLLLLGSGVVAHAFTPEWSVSGAYEKIVAADCRDCEEDIGILFACTGNGQPAELTVNAAASERGQDGAFAPVSFDIDGQTFAYEAKTVEYGLIGFTPVFQIAYDDPLTGALQAGHNAIVTFNGQRSEINLKGSHSALDIFKAHCGWTPIGYRQNLARAAAANPPQAQQPALDPNTGMPPFSQTVLTRTPATQDPGGKFWFTGDAFGGGSPKTLNYAVPESDDRGLFASCEDVGNNGTLVEVYTSFGNLGAGEAVTLEISHAQGTSRYVGRTFIENEEYAGSRFVLNKGDPVWQILANTPQVAFGIQGEHMIHASGTNGQAALNEFALQCQN